MALTVFHFGAAVGAVLAGFLIKLLPYWHLVFVGLVLHTVSYVIYAVTWTAWLIVLSKLLSGIFIGWAMTLTFAYYGTSYEDYHAALKELGKEDEKRRVKDRLFALDSVSFNIGYLLCQG